MENPQIIFSWKAPLRPNIKNRGNVFRFFLAVAVLCSAIILFLGDWILIIPIATLLFLFYVLVVTPTPEVENKITKFGVETAGLTLRWDELSHFYFSERYDTETLTLVSHAPFFYHAHLVVSDSELKKRLISELSKHIVYQEKPQRGFVDRLTHRLSALIFEESKEEFRHSSASHQTTQPASP